VIRAIVPTHHSRAIARIGAALATYAPADVEVIGQPASLTKECREMAGEEHGDLVVLYANGLRDRYQGLADRCIARGQRYAVVQIALRTTRHPKTSFWRRLWAGAVVVWSYYDLPLWIQEDGDTAVDFPWYHAPLGVDGEVFTATSGDRPITVCTSGAQRNQESVKEVDEATKAIGGTVLQLGPTFPMQAETIYRTGISDADLAGWYQRCQWVSGLRRHEGFELPAAEGLLCGARPLVYDRPHYRHWYAPWADFITEAGKPAVTAQLRDLFARGPRPVTAEERAAARRLFDWAAIARGFWARCLA